MLATVVKVEEKAGQKAPFWVVHVEGEEKPIYAFDPKVGRALVPGLWELDIDTSGRFPKVKAARPVASVNGSEPAQAEGEGERAVTVHLVVSFDPQALAEFIGLLAEVLKTRS